MTSPDFSSRFRRSYRRSWQQVGDISTQAEEQVEQHIVQRLSRLIDVRRFIVIWLSLLVLLISAVIAQTRALSGYYQTLQPLGGGTYTEGILGDFTNTNPLYATGPVDSAVSKLLFASLFTYDSKNQLVGDLANNWTADTTGRIYTVNLKPGLTWQDGEPLTADDVVFTYNTIQNPDAQSPLNASWQGVVVAKTNLTTITFTLPNALTAFPYSLTNGIVPKHILGALPAVEMRSASFNTTNPIGAGPFAWQTIQVLGTSPSTRQEEIALTPFGHYHGGAPKLNSFIIRSFHDKEQLVNSFRHNELDGISGLDAVPKSIASNSNLQSYRLPLTGASMVFFKNSAGVLSDSKVRQALLQAADVNHIIVGLDHPVIPVREPLLTSQLGFNPAYVQTAFNSSLAMQALQADGWIPGAGGIRYKDKQPLSFKLYSNDSAESKYVLRALKRQWLAVGVDVQLFSQPDSDLQNAIAFHSYDALLYNISIGVDPDVFAYWDSSQADVHSATRLNLSEYKSTTADAALEGGRTRADPGLRIIKYKPFLAAWQQDAPALGLYQPDFLYITREPVFGLSEHTINTGIDRYNNVQNWEIRTAKVAD